MRRQGPQCLAVSFTSGEEALHGDATSDDEPIDEEIEVRQKIAKPDDKVDVFNPNRSMTDDGS